LIPVLDKKGRKMFKRFTFIFVTLFFLTPAVSFPAEKEIALPSVADLTPEDRGISPVEVMRSGDNWIIKGRRNTITVNGNDFGMTVVSGSTTWSMLPSAEDDITIQVDTSAVKLELGVDVIKVVEDSSRVKMKLADAENIEITPYETGYKTGIKIQLGGFKHKNRELDLELQLFITLETAEDELLFEAVPLENENAIKELRWPRSFLPGSTDFTVLPYRQGVLLPQDWPKEAVLRWRMTHTVSLYMPWWGHLKGEAAAFVLLETPDDAGCNFEHPAGGPTIIEPLWVHSLGSLKYPRKVRMCFLEKAGYVELAKRYRKYAIETGHFVSLKEKIARTPLLKNLIGSPVAHFGITSRTMESSRGYNKKKPERNLRVTSFDKRTEQLEKLATMGVKKLYVHMDGWGYRGYDNLHPEYLPASPEAGGWEGMKRIADTCDRLGYVLALHDQYRDYYHDAPSYDTRHTVVLENGERPSWAVWAGGKQSLLCSSFAKGFVARNHGALKAHGIKVRGSYLDVFACNPMDECYNPEHPVSRSQCLKNRAECFNLIRAMEGIVSSEEPVDWAIPYLDLVHHGPYAVSGRNKEAMGIIVPLFNLVYHDAIIIPWFTVRGGYAIPKKDLGLLHALMNAGIPYISLDPDEEEFKNVRTICALHYRTGLLEMTNHEFLDNSYRKHRTTFADGTTVSVDFDTEEYEILPPLDLK
jgi:uncharacterized protein DUF5696